MTLFEQCCDAVVDANALIRLPDGGVALDHVTAVKAVLSCVLAKTPSPRTVDEMERILGEAPASAPYVA